MKELYSKINSLVSHNYWFFCGIFNFDWIFDSSIRKVVVKHHVRSPRLGQIRSCGSYNYEVKWIESQFSPPYFTWLAPKWYSGTRARQKKSAHSHQDGFLAGAMVKISSLTAREQKGQLYQGSQWKGHVIGEEDCLHPRTRTPSKISQPEEGILLLCLQVYVYIYISMIKPSTVFGCFL